MLIILGRNENQYIEGSFLLTVRISINPKCLHSFAPLRKYCTEPRQSHKNNTQQSVFRHHFCNFPWIMLIIHHIRAWIHSCGYPSESVLMNFSFRCASLFGLIVSSWPSSAICWPPTAFRVDSHRLFYPVLMAITIICYFSFCFRSCLSWSNESSRPKSVLKMLKTR